MKTLVAISVLGALTLGACEHPAPPITSASHPPSSTPPAASAPETAEAVPSVRLPSDTRPTAEEIELAIDPTQPRFAGTAVIDVTLDHPRAVVWLHGRDFHVSRATVTPEGGTPIDAKWDERDDGGVASLTLASPAPAGKARITITFDAPFAKGLNGLYTTKQGEASYAFTQFEPIDARRAFPCFDEPGFKIPFTETLVVPSGAQAITNTPEVDRAPTQDGKVRVRFAKTRPLPSYLVAFAVGPLDVVNAPDVPPSAVRSKPLPLRIIAAKGRGPELAYAVRHSGEIVATLETYFGIAYPYDKLDMIAVPDREGAMENAGAIMYAERELVVNEKTASTDQIQSYAQTVAHETAHQWFGDLVTMAWWDDLWLNESFATFMGHKTVDTWNPALHGSMDLLARVQGSIGQDALATARKIRQPILARTDIESAFDGITYGKGAAVLGMFERWVGAEPFRRGIHTYLSSHAYGSATADDFLSAMSTAAARDVSTPFRTFLDQPGVPFLDTSVVCESGAGKTAKLHVKQSRYFPVGTTGDANHTWQVPVCARYAVKGKSHESCALVTEAEGDVPLDGCPEWIVPNAAALGYYRFGLPKDQLASLSTKGFTQLTPAEKVAFGNAIRAQLNRATTPIGDLFDVVAPFAKDPDPGVAEEPMNLAADARTWLYGDPLRAKLEAHERALYAGVAKTLGWDAKKGEGADRAKLRGEVLAHLALDANDPATRAEAKKRALAYLGKGDAVHPEALAAETITTALAVAAQEGGDAFFDALHARLAKTEDAALRGRFIGALSRIEDPKLSARSRDLALDETLRLSERLPPIADQMSDPATQEAAWAWLNTHLDELLGKFRALTFAGPALISVLGAYCDSARADAIEKLLAPRLASIDGGARAAAHAVEEVRLCAAKRATQEPSARAYFSAAK